MSRLVAAEHSSHELQRSQHRVHQLWNVVKDLRRDLAAREHQNERLQTRCALLLSEHDASATKDARELEKQLEKSTQHASNLTEEVETLQLVAEQTRLQVATLQASVREYESKKRPLEEGLGSKTAQVEDLTARLGRLTKEKMEMQKAFDAERNKYRTETAVDSRVAAMQVQLDRANRRA